jgi:hypothetical protein
MRKLVTVLMGAAVLSVALSGMAMAQSYPNVSGLTSFSASADYMSLAGYLRYLTHQQTGQWLTYQEAGRMVQQ